MGVYLKNMDELQIEELKQFLDTVKTRYTKSKRTLDNIEGLEIRFQKASDAAGKIVTESETVKTGILTLQAQAKTIVEQIQESRIGISGYLDAAKITIDNLQELSNSAATLKGQIDGGKGEIEALLSNARNLTEDTTKFKKSAEENLSISDKLLTDFQHKAGLMKEAFVEFTEIKKKIDDKTTGLDVVLKLVQQAQADSQKLVSEINESLKASKANEVEILEIKERTKASLGDILVALDEVNNKKLQVEDVAGLVIDGSFAHTFEKRKQEIYKGLDSDLFAWKYLMLLGVILLIVLEFAIGNSNDVQGFLNRISYSSPLIFLILFSAVQYSKDRQYLEKYAFKAASAAVIRNHIEFLIEKFKSDKRVMDFAIDAFNSLYTEPFKHDLPIQAVDKEVKNKKTVLDNGVKNLVDLADRLYELIPDEVIVKQALNAVLDKKIK